MPRACWICGGTPASEEHVWPKWLKSITEHATGTYRTGITSDPAGWHQWTMASFEHTSRVLCRPCNRRLGELEARVGPVVPRLLEGGLTSISSSEQTDLGQWLYKTGLMVSTTMDPSAAGLPRRHYTGLGETLDLPPASVVWIGRLDGRIHEAALWVQRFQWWDRHLSNPPAAEGYVFVLGVGELAAVVGVLDVSQSPESTEMDPWILGSLGIGRLLRTWPPSEHYGIRWPPPEPMTGEDLQGIAAAFAQWASKSGPAATD